MEGGFLIRRASQNDYDFVIHAVHEMVKICVGKNHIPFIPDDVAHSLFNQFVENPKHSTTFVAEKNGKCVGVAISQYHHTLHYLGPICNLQNHELLMPNPGTKLDKERNRFYEKRGYNLEGYSRYKTLKPPFYIK